MPKIIKIGTRDSALALWQAQTVQHQLEHLGHKTQIVPIKSEGDLVLNKPIYEMGTIGVFTKSLDIALLNEEIDIAVHSMKDVPTSLANGTTQAAVLKRGKWQDVLIFKKNEEFLGAHGTIATGSLRRKAQWLNRYPQHQVENLRGNIDTRIQKLDNQAHWNGAIFALAGIKRRNIKVENLVVLDWMIPAPAQGAIVITTLEENSQMLEACEPLNDEETTICTKIERDFLHLLEGGCTAPIGAYASIDEDEKVTLKGIILSYDGKRKLEVTETVPIHEHHVLAQKCAQYIIDRGGKLFLKKVTKISLHTDIYSTKKLTDQQNQLFPPHTAVKSYDAIQISHNRLSPLLFKKEYEHLIFTSKNAVDALLNSISKEQLKFDKIYCVGRRTRKYIEQQIGPVTQMAKNANELAKYLEEQLTKKDALHYFCGNMRLDTLPERMQNAGITLHEIVVYNTRFNEIKIENTHKGVMFYSPSTIYSFLKFNKPEGIAFCIGESTAKIAKEYFSEVRVAKIPTVESTIESVNNYLLFPND